MVICPICNSEVTYESYAGREDERCPICKGLRRHRDNLAAMRRAGIFELPSGSPLLMVSIDPYLRRLEHHFNVTVLIKQHAVPGTVYGDICKPPFKAETFSVVIASHVLEHVHNDAKALAMIYKLLAPGGIFISNVPCGTTDMTVEFDHPDPLQHGHWRLYGRKAYRQLLYGMGFRQIKNRSGTAFTAKRPR